jgi:hypothetical protein
MLSIPEKIFLLSLYEKRNGSIQANKSPYLYYGLIAGGLMQIVLSKVGQLNPSRKIVITNPTKEYQSIPSDLLRQILYEKDNKKCNFWIEALGRKRKRIEEDFFNLFFEKKLLIKDGQVCHFHPEAGKPPTLKFIIKEEIRQQILGGKIINLEDFGIIKLMDSVHLLDQIFTYDEIKPIHLQIDQMKHFDLKSEDDAIATEGIHGILESLNQVINSVKG